MFRLLELETVHWDYWRNFKLPLDAPIITISGPNGSGKTTLLDAMRTLLALECSKKRDYKRYVRRNGEDFCWLRGVVDNQRPQDHQQRHGILGQAEVAGLPGIVLLEHRALAFARERNADVGGKGVRQQAQAAGGETLFHFVAESGVHQQAAHFLVFARQVALRKQARDQARGVILVHDKPSTAETVSIFVRLCRTENCLPLGQRHREKQYPARCSLCVSGANRFLCFMLASPFAA